MTKQTMGKKLEKKGEDLVNENYHSEAEFYFDLAERVRDGRLGLAGDGEKVLVYLLDYSW